MNSEIRRLILVAAIAAVILGTGASLYANRTGSVPVAAYTQIAPRPAHRQQNIQFAVIGDYGKAGPAASAVARMVKSWQPDFIITTGDNNYPDGSLETIDANVGQYYSEYIYPYKGIYLTSTDPNRFFPSLGNHDLHSDNGQAYLDYFPISTSRANTGSSRNERYYDFIQGPVHFFVLDSNPVDPIAIDVQTTWLRAQLAGSTTAWQIVYFHHPPYSSGRHGSDKAMQLPFQDWGIDAVLSGHDHNYERIMNDGLLHFVIGVGGKGIRHFRPITVQGSQMRFNENYGAMRINATSTSLTFQFYAITDGGQLVDSFTVLKQLDYQISD